MLSILLQSLRELMEGGQQGSFPQHLMQQLGALISFADYLTCAGGAREAGQQGWQPPAAFLLPGWCPHT